MQASQPPCDRFVSGIAVLLHSNVHYRVFCDIIVQPMSSQYVVRVVGNCRCMLKLLGRESQHANESGNTDLPTQDPCQNQAVMGTGRIA